MRLMRNLQIKLTPLLMHMFKFEQITGA